MKSFKTIGIYNAFSICALFWIALFGSVFAIYEILNIFFSAMELFKFINDFLKNTDTFLGNMEGFFVRVGFSSSVAEKIAAVPFAFMLFSPAIIASLFIAIPKEIVTNDNGNIAIKRRFGFFPIEFSAENINEIQINKYFQITGRANMSGDLFKEVQYVGTVYPVKIKTLTNSYRLLMKGEILTELKKELSEIKFIEKDLNKNIYSVIFLIVVSAILLVFFKIYSKLGI